MARVSVTKVGALPGGPPPPAMRAAVFAGPGRVVIAQRPVPALGDDDVLLAVDGCGICGTDLHILEDPPGHPATPGVVLGHEMIGRVAARGPAARGLSDGDRVAVAPNLPCGWCRFCKLGAPSHCEHLSALGIFRDGGLAEWVTAPASACHRIGEAVPTAVAALAEPLSCVLNGVDQAQPLAGEVALVLGAGAIGLLFVAVLRASGVRCVVVEPVAARRALAERLGAVAAVDPEAVGAEADLDGLLPEGADLVVDAVGSQLAVAVPRTRPRGRVVLFGMDSRARAAVTQNDLTRHEIRLLGSYVGDHAVPRAVRLLESGLVDVEPIVSRVWPLERLPDALTALRAGRAVKIVLAPALNPGA